MKEQQDNQIAIIKKYRNRRLYNTQTSCYVTLEDLFEMIGRNEVFEVKDANNGEDLTRNVLTQIIFEQESKGYNLLPISFLRQLVGLYSKGNSNVTFPKYLDSSMKIFLKNQDQLEKMTNDYSQINPLKMIENATKENIKMFEDIFSVFGFVSSDKNKK